MKCQVLLSQEKKKTKQKHIRMLSATILNGYKGYNVKLPIAAINIKTMILCCEIYSGTYKRLVVKYFACLALL